MGIANCHKMRGGPHPYLPLVSLLLPSIRFDLDIPASLDLHDHVPHQEVGAGVPCTWEAPLVLDSSPLEPLTPHLGRGSKQWARHTWYSDKPPPGRPDSWRSQSREVVSDGDAAWCTVNWDWRQLISNVKHNQVKSKLKLDLLPRLLASLPEVRRFPNPGISWHRSSWRDCRNPMRRSCQSTSKMKNVGIAA